MFQRFFIFLLLFLPTCLVAKSLAPTEQKITQYLNSQKQQQLLLLEKLVNINSGTTNIEGVMQVGNILKSQFDQLGFKTEWIALPKTMHRAPTLIATHQGNQGKRLLLIGHLDTVFNKDSSFQRYQRRGNVAIGPGVSDMKGGDVVILFAMKALHAINALDHANIIIVLTGDEEDSGKPTSISRKPLFNVARNSDIALDFESMVAANTAAVARRGVLHWQLETFGKSTHSASIFSQDYGDGAIFECNRILDGIRRVIIKEKNLTFNPALIGGGTDVKQIAVHDISATGKDNVIAKKVIARGDMRYLNKPQLIMMQEKMLKITKHHLPKTQATLSFQEGIPSMPPKSANYDLLKAYSNASLDLNVGKISALPPNARGAGDISHIAELVSANLVGLGPLGEGEHSTKETMDIPSLSTQTKRAALLIYRLTR